MPPLKVTRMSDVHSAATPPLGETSARNVEPGAGPVDPGGASISPQRCGAVTPSGEPCPVHSRGPSGLCLFHDPARREEAAAARARGRARTAQLKALGWRPQGEPPKPPTNLDDVARWTAWVAYQVACGKLDAPRAKAIVASLSVARGAFRERDLTEQVVLLARQVRELKERSP
jgi:hypothetical protein